MTIHAIDLATARRISAKDTITTLMNRRRKESRREVKETLDKQRGKAIAEDGIQQRIDGVLFFTDRKRRARI